MLLRSLRDRVGRGFWDWGWSRGDPDNTPPSDDVIPPIAQNHLLGRGTAPLSFRGGRLACGGALSGLLGRLICKSSLRFFPLDTAPVVRSVVAPAATTLGLFPRGRSPTGEVGPPHATHRGAYPQFSLSDRTFDNSAPCATEAMKWGWEGGRLWGPSRGGRNEAA